MSEQSYETVIGGQCVRITSTCTATQHTIEVHDAATGRRMSRRIVTTAA